MVPRMPIGKLTEIIDRRPENARLMALDVGKKTLGVAISDSRQSIATPLQTVRRTKFTRDIIELGKIIGDYGIGGYVLGYPVNMDGSEGPRCESVRHFADEMLNHPEIFGADPWVAFWDERLSTASVEDFVGEYVNISKAKDKGVIDKLAAQTILQGALDFIGVARG